jgi:hypothetical protein
MKSMLFALSLLLSATLLAQQESANPQPGSNPSDTAASRQKTIQGCLKGDGNSFTLIDDSGTTYQLEGDSAKLKNHVGHEVQVAGTVGKASGSTSSTSTGDISQPAIQVVDVKHVSSSCSSKK